MNTKTQILNPDLAAAVTGSGHFDMLTIADCGLPLPAGPQVIDLSLRRGVPSFQEVLKLVASEMAVEKLIVAKEIRKNNPAAHEAVKAAAKSLGNIKIEYVSHEEFKATTGTPNCKWIVRTGDNTPYANVILVAGVKF